MNSWLGKNNVIGLVIISALFLVLFWLDVLAAIVLFLTSVIIYWHGDRFRPVGVKLPGYLLGALFLLGMGAPLFIAHYKWSAELFDGLSAGNGAEMIIAFLVAGTLLGGWLYGAVKWPYRTRWFVLAGLIFFGAVKLYYVISVEAQAVSDFRSMLIQADRWVMAGGIPPFSEMGSWIQQVHAERIVFYLYPIRLLFGESAAFQYVNVLVSLASSLIAAWLAFRFFGPVAGRVALVFSMFAIEPLQAAEIPTHDIPGAFSLLVVVALSVLLVDEKYSRWVRIFLSLGLGVALLWLGMQRGISSVVIIALIGFGVLAWIHEVSRDRTAETVMRASSNLLFLAVIPVVTFMLSSSLLSSLDLKRSVEDVSARRAVAISAHTESWGNGSYGYWKKNWLKRDIPEDAPMAFALKRFASDIYYSPIENVAHYFRKARRLYAFGSHQGFYLNGATLRGDRKITGEDIRVVRHVSNLHQSIFLILLCAGGILAFYRTRKPDAAVLPLVVLSTFSLILILFAEVQSRYLFPIWYLGSVYAAYGFVALVALRGRSNREFLYASPSRG